MRSAKLKEYKWRSYVLVAINSEDWQNRYEVEQRLLAILPTEALNRAHERHWNKQKTIHSFACTLIGSSIRGLVRNGLIERSIPIDSRPGKNVGNYSLKLTKKGAARRARIRHYFCLNCFNSGLSVPLAEVNIQCGHCRGRHLTIAKL